MIILHTDTVINTLTVVGKESGAVVIPISRFARTPLLVMEVVFVNAVVINLAHKPH